MKKLFSLIIGLLFLTTPIYAHHHFFFGSLAVIGLPSATTASFKFDGVDERLSIPKDAALTPSDNLSIVVWVKYASQAGSIVADRTDNFDGTRFWSIQTRGVSNDKVTFVMYGSTGVSAILKNFETSIVVGDDLWHQLGMTFNAGTFKIYVDGVEDTSPNKLADSSFTTLNTATGDPDIGIGASGRSAGGAEIVANIDEFSMWDTVVLSSSDFSTLFNEGKTSDASSLSTSANLLIDLHMEPSDDVTGTVGGVKDTTTIHNATAINMEVGDIDTVEFPQ